MHRDAEHLCQLVNEASRAGGAGLVHLVVNHHAIALDDQLGVLPANLDDVSLRVYLGGGSGLRGDFVFDEVGTDKTADQIPPGSGNSHAGNPDAGGTIQKQVVEDLLHSINRPAGGHQVVLGQDFSAGLVQDNGFGARGADINAEVANTWFSDFQTCPIARKRHLLQPGHLEISLKQISFGEQAYPGSFFLRQQSCPERFNIKVILGHDDPYLMAVSCRESLVECSDNGAVGRHAADKINWFLKSPFLQGGDHPGNALAQGIEHGLDGDPFLLQVNEVAFGKDTAPGGDSWRFALAFEGKAGKILKADVKAVCLLLEKSSRARRAERI